MLDGILTPAFLQAACAKKQQAPVINEAYTAVAEDPTITSLTCVGEITVVSTKDGVEKAETYNDLTASPVAIEADINTVVTISGTNFTINELGDELVPLNG